MSVPNVPPSHLDDQDTASVSLDTSTVEHQDLQSLEKSLKDEIVLYQQLYTKKFHIDMNRMRSNWNMKKLLWEKQRLEAPGAREQWQKGLRENLVEIEELQRKLQQKQQERQELQEAMSRSETKLQRVNDKIKEQKGENERLMKWADGVGSEQVSTHRKKMSALLESYKSILIKDELMDEKELDEWELKMNRTIYILEDDSNNVPNCLQALFDEVHSKKA